MTAKPRSGPGARTGAAARSGPSTPRALRARRPVEVTLSTEARELLDAEAARVEETRSALVEALVLRHLPGEAYWPPALVERAQALAARRGHGVEQVLAEALDAGLRALEES